MSAAPCHPVQTAAFVIDAGLILFQIWLLLAPQQPLFERPIHLGLALVLLFLHRPLQAPAWPRALRIAIDGALIVAALAVTAYYLIEFPRLTTRMENVSPVLPVDMAAGAALVLLLEGARRAVGMILVWVLLVFILYAFWSNLLPGWLGFRGFDGEAAVEIATMTTAGVLGITTSISVNFIFYFILFGAF